MVVILLGAAALGIVLRMIFVPLQQRYLPDMPPFVSVLLIFAFVFGAIFLFGWSVGHQ